MSTLSARDTWHGGNSFREVPSPAGVFWREWGWCFLPCTLNLLIMNRSYTLYNLRNQWLKKSKMSLVESYAIKHFFQHASTLRLLQFLLMIMAQFHFTLYNTLCGFSKLVVCFKPHKILSKVIFIYSFLPGMISVLNNEFKATSSIWIFLYIVPIFVFSPYCFLPKQQKHMMLWIVGNQSLT